MYQLPVNPEKLEVTYAGNNVTKEIVSMGEIKLLQNRKLATLSISSWFPESNWFSGLRTSGGFLSAKVYDEFFRMIQDSQDYMRLVVTGINLNMLVAIENYKPSHKAGDHEDLYYTLDLTEYKAYNAWQVPITSENIAIAQRNVLSTGSGGTGASADAVGTPTQVTVGSLVLVTGKLFYTSYGQDSGGQTLRDYQGRISHINENGSHPYHITTTTGGWLGWVTRESVTLV